MFKRQGIELKEEIKITKKFDLDHERYRICYIPKNNKDTLVIQLNYKMKSFKACVIKIIKFNRYKVIKLLLNKKYLETEKDMKEFMKEIEVNEYHFDYINSEDEFFKDHILLCIITKKDTRTIYFTQ